MNSLINKYHRYPYANIYLVQTQGDGDLEALLQEVIWGMEKVGIPGYAMYVRYIACYGKNKCVTKGSSHW